MLELRLTQHPAKRGRHKVEIALEGDGARRTAESTFAFALSSQDEEAMRWYLEDFLQYPQEPAPKIAERIEERLAAIGRELFEAVFKSPGALALWNKMNDRLPETRVEIVTGVAEANVLPWELLRDPVTEAPLALSAQAFVRAQPDVTRRVRLPARKRSKVRILLVICRPKGAVDVPFRSVASRLVKGLDQTTREAYDLDVLRPPTFEQLGRVLREAKAEGRPYHVVHFDGHGTFAEVASEGGGRGSLLRGLSTVVMTDTRGGSHGYLLFENPQLEDNAQLVDGPALGKLLAENDVPVLVLNACKSAHAEPGKVPGAEADPHSQVRAFGSLAQEVMDAGTAGVVAMRYNVYVVTAAQLSAELYASLAQGSTLGEAATRARKNLSENPWREIAFEPRRLQDWPVPVVYEAAPLQLFPRATGDLGALKIQVTAGASAAGVAGTAEGSLDADLPAPPDAGFFGRDETLLALDRAFDRDPIVLLHAYAGSGKTSTAAEFARWYSLTGGVEGPVLFTSFERYMPLARVLDRIGQVFGPALERSGIHWLASDDATRRQVALRVLAQVPVLWIWDNVEPIAGFPTGTPSAWSPAEQEELASFLRAAKGTKAKLLLTSRRDERPWLGDLPTRVQVPPMPRTEALQLARALAEKQGRRLSAVEDWRPLLDFAQGNPMTLTVLVGQALREGWVTREAIASYVERLRAGEAAFPDEAGEGRARSLAASLAYGFEHAFGEEERGRLALLHLFQGFVDVDALRWMGNPEDPWCLPEVKGLAREEGIALLDRAAEVGLLTAHGGGYYAIHPALPWFFQGLYLQRYPEDSTARRAFVEVLGVLGSYYHNQYEGGNRGVLAALRAEEANLLHARRLARAHGWWHRVTSAMQGLKTLYEPTGRRAEWKRLVEEIVPDFVDPGTGGPRPGREEDWGLVTQYRVRFALEERQWGDAERLQTALASWARQRAAAALARRAGELEGKERHAIRTLAASLHELGGIRRELGNTDCMPAYEESLELAEQIGDRPLAAICAFNLGAVFEDLPALRDLDAAERWYLKSLDLYRETDCVGRGRCLGQLGSVVYARFQEARASEQPEAELLRCLNEAARLYHEALGLLPPDAVDDLAVAHNALGTICGTAGDLDRALTHYQQAVGLFEASGAPYRAAQARFNVAIHLLAAGRRADALEYAEAALRGFEPYGEGAAEWIEKTRRLIAYIRGA